MSAVIDHFPQIKFRKGEKYLWNPIQKKALKNRPEERIRLRVIEYLLEAGWSKHRISAEEGISSTRKEKLRTDLICYTKEFDPFLLVECKAPNIRLSNQTAEQIARYNNNVNAPHLLITNGKTDLWYSFKEEKPVLQVEAPEPLQTEGLPTERPFEYCTERGFAGKKAAPELQKWLTEALNTSVFKTDHSLRYLSFKKKLYDADLNHYYIVFSHLKNRVAVAFIATAFGGSRLTAIENKNGKNTAVFEINLDLLFSQENKNASLYNSAGKRNLNIREEMDWDEEEFELRSFSEKVKELFEGFEV